MARVKFFLKVINVQAIIQYSSFFFSEPSHMHVFCSDRFVCISLKYLFIELFKYFYLQYDDNMTQLHQQIIKFSKLHQYAGVYMNEE